MLSGFRTFRMDCFAFISKTKVSSRRNLGAPKGTFWRRIRTSPNNEGFSLGVIRFLPRSPLLLIVSQHAGGSWLASAEDSGYTNIARQQLLSQKLALIRLEVSIGTGKWRFRIGRPHFSCLCYTVSLMVPNNAFLKIVAVHLKSHTVVYRNTLFSP